jgi:hypothetical protein
MRNSVHQEILENGLDFLLHSLRPPVDLDEYADAEILPKYLVLNLAAATELILKARLCKEHWSLIFQNPDKASADCLRSGEFCSVTFDTCVIRLERICGVTFSTSAREVLRDLRARRNCYQHLRIAPDPRAATPLAGKVLHFLLGFLDTSLESDDFTSPSHEALRELRPRLGEFHDLRETRLAQLKVQIQSLLQAGRLERCVACGERTLELNPTVKCLFCNWSVPAAEAAATQAAEEEARRKESLYQRSLFPMPPLPYVRVRQCERCGAVAAVCRSPEEAGMALTSSKCYACGASNGAPAA